MQLMCTPISDTFATSHLLRAPLSPLTKFATPLTPQLSSACLEAALRLRDVCAATGRVDYEESDRLNEAWDVVHAQQAHRWKEHILSTVRIAAEKANAEIKGLPSKATKPGFNYEYIPLLEKYFEHNAYPSAADRLVLARKSMMTPRQIEVWFQNHRNRRKKEGKPLRRLSEESLPLDLTLKSLERDMPFFTIPEHERKPKTRHIPLLDDSSDSEHDIATISASPTTDILNPPRPQYAYPAVYTPHLVKGSNSRSSTVAETCHFSPPIWFRTPASIPVRFKSKIDMDDFIVEFSQKLHLRAPVPSKPRQNASKPWCAYRVTVPYPVPHPALIRSIDYIGGSSSTSCNPHTPVLTPGAQAMDSPSLSSLPMMLSLSQGPNKNATRRKIVRIPKRSPLSESSTHHRGSPPISEPSPSPRSTSSTSRRSSTSLESSPPSSSLSTPVLVPSSLHEHTRSPVILAFDIACSAIDDSLGDMSPLWEGVSPTPSAVARSKIPPSLQIPLMHSSSKDFLCL